MQLQMCIPVISFLKTNFAIIFNNAIICSKKYIYRHWPGPAGRYYLVGQLCDSKRSYQTNTASKPCILSMVDCISNYFAFCSTIFQKRMAGCKAILAIPVLGFADRYSIVQYICLYSCTLYNSYQPGIDWHHVGTCYCHYSGPYFFKRKNWLEKNDWPGPLYHRRRNSFI